MKYIKIILAAITALTMTACSDTNTAEVTDTSAETKESITTVSEKTTETVSETDTLSAESEETTTKTSVEPVESVSDMEAIEEAENTHWDTIVYDKTLVVDVTDWKLETENVVKSDTICTLAEALELSGMPDAVTAYLYENSSTYKMCFDNNEEIRGIASGVKDFDSDGVEETFYAVNYLWYDWELSTVAGRHGALQSDIVVYDTTDEKVYLCDTAADNYVTHVGCYFACDPAAECKSLDTSRYEECFTWEGTNMYFTEDNIFISCNLEAMDIGFADAYNRYNRLVYENGEYRVESVGTAGWCLNVPPFADDVDVPDCYRTASVTGDVPCILK